jgi:hypothetical protein
MPVKSKGPKKQTRLQFSPLPSSSPAKEKYSNPVKDRLTTVRHDYAGLHQTPKSADDERDITALPTPEKSSQQDILIKDGTVSRAECPILLTDAAVQNPKLPHLLAILLLRPSQTW